MSVANLILQPIDKWHGSSRTGSKAQRCHLLKSIQESLSWDGSKRLVLREGIHSLLKHSGHICFDAASQKQHPSDMRLAGGDECGQDYCYQIGNYFVYTWL